MRLRTLRAVYRFEPYAQSAAAHRRLTTMRRMAAALWPDQSLASPPASPTWTPPDATCAWPEAGAMHPASRAPREAGVPVRTHLLEAAVAAWPDILTEPAPGALGPNPPSWAAWSRLFAALLMRASRCPTLVGLDVWLADVQRTQLARTFLPPEDAAGPLAFLACRIGAQYGSPRTFNVVRRLLELREALWLAEVLPAGHTIDVGCDQKKVGGQGSMLAPSSDLAISNAAGRVLRRIEVTSLHKAATGSDSLRRALGHVLRKAHAEAGQTTHEGCLAVHFAPGVSARGTLRDVVQKLNAPVGWAPIWADAATTLDRVTFVDYRPTQAPEVFGCIVRQDGLWQLRPELRVLRRTVARRMSTGMRHQPAAPL